MEDGKKIKDIEDEEYEDEGDEDELVDYDAQVKIEALINLLVKKGIIKEEEFDEEFDKVCEEDDSDEENRDIE